MTTPCFVNDQYVYNLQLRNVWISKKIKKILQIWYDYPTEKGDFLNFSQIFEKVREYGIQPNIIVVTTLKKATEKRQMKVHLNALFDTDNVNNLSSKYFIK